MCIIHPQEIKKKDKFLTHPPTEKRIRILMSMSGFNYEAYHKAYMEVLKKQKNLFKKEFNKNIKEILKSSKKLMRYIVNSLFLIEDGIQNNALTETVNSIPPYLPQYLNEIEALNKNSNNNYETCKAFRKRQAYDIVWKESNYIFKECTCGTKLKFPNAYRGKEINCPHCNKIIRVEETDHKNE